MAKNMAIHGIRGKAAHSQMFQTHMAASTVCPGSHCGSHKAAPPLLLSGFLGLYSGASCLVCLFLGRQRHLFPPGWVPITDKRDKVTHVYLGDPVSSLKCLTHKEPCHQSAYPSTVRTQEPQVWSSLHNSQVAWLASRSYCLCNPPNEEEGRDCTPSPGYFPICSRWSLELSTVKIVDKDYLTERVQWN